MKTKPLITSKALEVNLENTRVEQLEIPADHQSFIRYSADYWGIHKRTEEFFHEYHHPFSNSMVVAEELRKILLSDQWFYHSLPNSFNCFKTLGNLVSELLDRQISAEVQAVLAKTIVEFLSQYGALTDSDPKVWDLFFSILEKCYKKYPRVICEISHFLKKNFASSFSEPQYIQKTFDFSRTVFKHNLSLWQEEAPIENWLEEKKRFFSSDHSGLVEQIGNGFFVRQLKQLHDANSWDDIEKHVASHSEIAAYYRNCIDCFDKSRERFYYLMFLLHIPAMSSLQDQLLWEINKLLRSVSSEMDEAGLIDFIDEIIELFKGFKQTHLSMVLDCILTLGKEVKGSDHRKVISFLENKLIEFGFVTPGIVYMKDDWQVHVDPNHIKNIRTWLELIESAPFTFRKLLSALIVNLRLGGIFIFDTDLFQRDISRLLNSNISPIYKQVKQLARIFPVYFNEIGAEGELREVTTLMDEISNRKDKLVHFLRKQVHIEGNNSHINLTFKILNFWYDGNLEQIKPLLPTDVFAAIDKESKWFTGVHDLVQSLCKEKHCSPVELLQIPEKEFDKLLEQTPSDSPTDKQRLKHLYRLYFLLREKYSFESIDVKALLGKYPFFEDASINEFEESLHSKQNEKAILLIFGFMKQLNDVICNPQYSEGWEDIYHKRHVAFGIPSMYGQYRESKFEALGLTFRLERIASRLMEEEINNFNSEYITARSLKTIYRFLKLFRQGLELDGITSQGFESNLQMLRYGLTSESFSLGQYINLFQFMAQSIKEIINTYFYRFYDQPLRMIVPQLFVEEGQEGEKEFNQLVHKKSELFYRDVMSSSFLIQLLDNFVLKVLDSLRNMVENLSPDVLTHIMSYDPELVISPLYKATEKVDNQIFLGSKAYFLKKLYLFGFPVPPGFVLTTEVFRRRNAIRAHKALEKELDDLIKYHIHQLETMTGKKYGSPNNPLLLSVRSGTAISMPGAMNTFLNVGMNDKIVEALSKMPNFGWTSWDCYRRFLQSWGMAHGIERDVFDEVMVAFKNKYHVEQKILFSSQQMREMAFAYKKVMHEHGVHFQDHPFEQLKQAILSVLDSWSSERAIVYRDHLQIAPQWGTAVVIQQMVLGNIDEKSGTGVVFTHSPHITKPGIYLNGDFTLCSQGEDIVAGLVHTLPVSDFQKDLLGDGRLMTMQNAFPSIYKRLHDISGQMMEQFGFGHQEIEFTFESDEAKDLFILQVRDQDTRKPDQVAVFKPQDMKLAGHGAAGGGGALNGIVAFDMEDIKQLMLISKDQKIILVRPDTVPDDIAMIFECDGLITGRGGATSHAAVAAARLGKVCILNCQKLVVDEKNKTCYLNGFEFHVGDKIAIDGHLGNIFYGHYDIEFTEVFSV